MTSSTDTKAKSVGAIPWRAVGTCPAAELTKARWETINLVQWLARIANSYVHDEKPERRTQLEFHVSDSAFVTKPFERNISLELCLPSLEMQFLDHGKPVPHIFDPQEHSPAQVEAWILVELLHRGIDREKFSNRLPYSMADLMSGDAREHLPQSCERGLGELASWFGNAAALFDGAARVLGGSEVHIVCLPQTLTLTCFSAPSWQQAKFGFSAGDDKDPEPFFYLLPVTAVSRKCTVLNASRLLAEPDPPAAAMRFLMSSGA
jgi:hypothetical protein